MIWRKLIKNLGPDISVERLSDTNGNQAIELRIYGSRFYAWTIYPSSPVLYAMLRVIIRKELEYKRDREKNP